MFCVFRFRRDERERKKATSSVKNPIDVLKNGRGNHVGYFSNMPLHVRCERVQVSKWKIEANPSQERNVIQTLPHIWITLSFFVLTRLYNEDFLITRSQETRYDYFMIVLVFFVRVSVSNVKHFRVYMFADETETLLR